MVFLNGGPAHQLSPAFSFLVRCDSQEELDSYWGKLIEGGKPMACGWLTDRFGLCWQIVPRNIGELISHPKAMEARYQSGLLRSGNGSPTPRTSLKPALARQTHTPHLWGWRLPISNEG